MEAAHAVAIKQDEVQTTMAKGVGGGGDKKGKIGKVATQILGMIANSAKGG